MILKVIIRVSYTILDEISLISINIILKCISKKRNKMEQESFKILREFIHGLDELG